LREVWAGHDGTWVAHPGLVPVAREVFDTHMPFPNQLDRPACSAVAQQDLLKAPQGPITTRGLEMNLDIGLQYLASWLGGNGCVPIYNLMEDAATAEISRAQVWQWVRHGALLENGERVTLQLAREILDRQAERLRDRIPEQQLSLARNLYDEMISAQEFPEFLTLRAYEYLE
jgi:malate synthase